MRKNRILPLKNRYTFLTATLPLFIVGILLAIGTMASAKKAIFEEHDQHLFDLARSIDHNISVFLTRCRQEMDAVIGTKVVAIAENVYISTGDISFLTKALRESVILAADYSYNIIVLQNNKVILSGESTDSMQYRRIDTEQSGEYCTYCDEATGRDFFSVASKSQRSGLTYVVLLDLEQLYRRVVVDSIYDKYWIVFYDARSGLLLRNDEDQPSYDFSSKEVLYERDDGLSFLVQQQECGEPTAKSYEYYRESGKKERSRMAVLPSSATENGSFAIAISIYDSLIEKQTQRRFLQTVSAALLIAFSSAVTVFFLLHSGERERELASELSSLEKENELAVDLVRRQEELAHHQKLETIGTLTAGIAHEFNNLLSPIMCSSMLILEHTPAEDSETYENALEIYKASCRAKSLIANISKLSRRSPSQQMQLIAPAELINSALALAASTMPKNISVLRDIRSSGFLMGNEVELGHMLLNLILNSVQAMEPDGGTLTVAVWDKGEQIIISVADTGCGIPKENLAMLFEPFFSTKESGKGTGLGLAIAQRTVTNHGGTITAENLPDGGAKFTVVLRRHERPEAED